MSNSPSRNLGMNIILSAQKAYLQGQLLALRVCIEYPDKPDMLKGLTVSWATVTFQLPAEIEESDDFRTGYANTVDLFLHVQENAPVASTVISSQVFFQCVAGMVKGMAKAFNLDLEMTEIISYLTAQKLWG